jgi:hypothetical protein
MIALRTLAIRVLNFYAIQMPETKLKDLYLDSDPCFTDVLEKLENEEKYGKVLE